MSLLASVVDAVSHLTSVLIAVNSEGGKLPEAPHVPRPVTALERAESRQVQQRREAFIAQILPHRAGNGTRSG